MALKRPRHNNVAAVLFFMVMAIGGMAYAAPSDSDRAAPDTATASAIAALRDTSFDTALQYERALADGPSFSAYLLSYRHAGLKLYAMVAEPKGERPESGFPILIANHGFVPDPRRYGITTDGVDARPGDYYRPVPELYAARGFIVVMPDYRGHNSSQGYDLITPPDRMPVSQYAEDVLALLSAVERIENADASRIFMWGHSMGGGVTMQVLLANGAIRAASLWSTISVSDLKPYLSGLKTPIIIHHATDDAATPYSYSTDIAAALEAAGQNATLYSYSGDAHFFNAADRAIAADRDAAFFLLH